MKQLHPPTMLLSTEERSVQKGAVGAQQFASFRRVDVWEGDAMILRETLLE